MPTTRLSHKGHAVWLTIRDPNDRDEKWDEAEHSGGATRLYNVNKSDDSSSCYVVSEPGKVCVSVIDSRRLTYLLY